jgi:hypothetical protein
MHPLYFVYHIPKTGGQTIRKHLQTHMEASGKLLFMGKGTRDRPLTREDIETLSPSELDGISAVCGHPLERSMSDLWRDRPLREVMFVRDPAERMVSHFNFHAAMRAKRNTPAQEFVEFFDSHGPNPMLSFAAKRLGVARRRDHLSEVIEALSSFWMVGTTQSIDLLSPKLFAALGIPDTKPRRANTSGADFPRVLSLTSEITDLVHQRDTEDLTFFEACKQMESITLMRFGLSPRPDFVQKN